MIYNIKVAMKIVAMTILIVFKSYGQVINDECFSSYYLGVLTGGSNSMMCFDGSFSHDTVINASTQGALVNCPYNAMLGCQGYTNSTVPSNDIWYKVQSGNFRIGVIPMSSGTDTIHLNVWVGVDCNNLSPSGCYTFDYIGNPLNHFYNFANLNTSNNVYLQFSSNGFNKYVDFQFCLSEITSPSISYFGTSSIYVCSGINELYDESISVTTSNAMKAIEIKSMQEIKSIELFNSSGQSVYFYKNLREKHTIFLADFSAGFYLLNISFNNKTITKKVVVFE